MNPLAILQLASQLLTIASGLLPDLEADLALWKQLGSTTDPAAVDAQIGQVHQDILAMTAKLDALRTPAG